MSCKDTPIGQHISNTQTILQLPAEDEKSIPPLNIDIFMRHGRLKIHTWFLLNSRNLFTPIVRPKIPAQNDSSILIFCKVLVHVFLKWKIGIVPKFTFTFIRKQKNGAKNF
jgi:hypothetical protein